MPLSDNELLDEAFTYHKPEADQVPKFEAINQAARQFAKTVLESCPPCADRSAAIRTIREARMTANAAIALRGKI